MAAMAEATDVTNARLHTQSEKVKVKAKGGAKKQAKVTEVRDTEAKVTAARAEEKAKDTEVRAEKDTEAIGAKAEKARVCMG